jgi:23S rRNA-/tRNA-specific pseudouridylate synthase
MIIFIYLVVHRLDRNTSGVLILAKDYATDVSLKQSMIDNQWRKEYICKVEGVFPRSIICHNCK